ncbi:MAG TPA: hypothetical protein VFN94_06755 [Nitrospiria bacterium]|nr:hypothetical protein [Nitrospiria bacterium]
MKRSITAVVVGYLVLAVAIAAKLLAMKRFVPEVLPAPGEDVFPDTAWLLAMLGSDIGLMIGAGYLTAMIASRTPVIHSVILGAAMVILGLVWMFVFWGWMPLWYQVVLVSIALPAAATGGMLRSPAGGAPTS